MGLALESQPLDPAAADAGRLGQVLGNLLARSRIDVSVEAKAGSVSITVDDDGPGLAEGNRERVFDRLVRLGDARNRADGGSGLGVPIARALSGDLVALAGPVGARFRVTLPREAG